MPMGITREFHAALYITANRPKATNLQKSTTILWDFKVKNYLIPSTTLPHRPVRHNHAE